MARNHCTDCPFNSMTCEPRGNVEAPIVFIGDAPTIKEIVDDKIFTDKSYQLLEILFKDNKEINLSNIYYLSAFSCCPPRNIELYKANLQKKINEACIACNSRLLTQIKSYPRKLIVTMGNSALRTLTNRFGDNITNKRGALIESDLAEIGILPIFNPTYILKNQQQLPVYKQDLTKIVNLLQGKIPKTPDYKITVITNQNINNIIEIANTPECTGFSADIETTGLHIYDDEITCIGLVPTPLINFSTPYNVYVFDDLLLFKQFLYLIPTTIEWCWHNGKFDIKHLHSNDCDPLKVKIDHDTMLLSYILDEVGGRHGLERCIMDWLGITGYKDMIEPHLKIGSKLNRKPTKKEKLANPLLNDTEIKHIRARNSVTQNITIEMIEQYIRTGLSKKAYALVPKALLYDYLGKDVIYTAWLKEKLYTIVKNDPALLQLYNKLLIPASNALAIIEMNGFPIDTDIAEQAAIDYQLKIDPLLLQMQQLLEWPKYNPNSPAQTKIALNDIRGLGVKDTRKDTLEEYKDSDEFVKKLLSYKTMKKVLTTYLLPYNLKNRTGKKQYAGLKRKRVNTSFLIHGTKTGRLSSTSPNVQNFTKLKEIRKIVKPNNDRVLVSMDYSQAELRSLAVLSGDLNLIAIFKSGKDLHTEVAISIFGDKYTNLKDGNIEKDLLRRVAKTLNFGIVYGVEAKTLSKNIKISITLAQQYINEWFNRFNTAKEFLDKTRNVENYELITKFGRKRRFHIITKQNRHGLANEAGNFLHQSMCSDFTLASCIKLHYPVNHIKQLSGNPIQINLIHDDNMFEIDNNTDHIKQLINIVKPIMENIPKQYGITEIPFKVDVQVGTAWDKMKNYELSN